MVDGRARFVLTSSGFDREQVDGSLYDGPPVFDEGLEEVEERFDRVLDCSIQILHPDRFRLRVDPPGRSGSQNTGLTGEVDGLYDGPPILDEEPSRLKDETGTAAIKTVEEDTRLYMLQQFHEGKCEVAIVDDGALSKSILGNRKCYLLDCGSKVFVLVGWVTQVEERKSVIRAAEDFVARQGRSQCRSTFVFDRGKRRRFCNSSRNTMVRHHTPATGAQAKLSESGENGFPTSGTPWQVRD
ncbi:villin 3 [Striga asiatica]|uniref:Villin 3 n=1 Tax=Striga asiatica TaxID=4170 RepID=A0A5A7PBB2_STRAF|nr:villin 3 [Striga asiatica]